MNGLVPAPHRIASPRSQHTIDAMLPSQQELPLGLHAMAVALVRNPATRPDHVLILSDALRELSDQHRIVGDFRTAEAVDGLILRLQAFASLLA